MNTSEELQTLVSDVHRKIGRNLMLLQYVEGMFKSLLIQSRVSGASLEELENFRSKRRGMIERHTLGELAGKFTSEILVKHDADSAAAEALLPTDYVTFKYTIEADDGYIAQRTESLKAIVNERNELVHQFLSKWNPLSIESTQATSKHLDQQQVRVAEEAKTLKSHLDGLQRSAESHQKIMTSPDYEKQMEMMWLQDSPLILLLVAMCRDTASTTGWVRLDDAGKVLWSCAKEDMAEMKAIYGYEKLKPLLLAAEVFDLREEPLSNGGVRVLFKLKPEAHAFYQGL